MQIKGLKFLYISKSTKVVNGTGIYPNNLKTTFTNTAKSVLFIASLNALKN